MGSCELVADPLQASIASNPGPTVSADRHLPARSIPPTGVGCRRPCCLLVTLGASGWALPKSKQREGIVPLPLVAEACHGRALTGMRPESIRSVVAEAGRCRGTTPVVTEDDVATRLVPPSGTPRP